MLRAQLACSVLGGFRALAAPRGRGGTAALGWPARPQLAAATLEAARAAAPGADVYALQAEWEAMWRRSGSPVLRSPDRAFLGWLARRGED